MNRLVFSSVMTIIRHYISPDHGMNQGELLDELLEKVVVHETTKDADGSRVRGVEIYYRFIGKIE